MQERMEQENEKSQTWDACAYDGFPIENQHTISIDDLSCLASLLGEVQGYLNFNSYIIWLQDTWHNDKWSEIMPFS